MIWLWLALPGAVIWGAILVLPWAPWRIREVLEPVASALEDLSDVTVLIPARNEARTLPGTLQALARQGPGLRVVVTDDQSEDETMAVASSVSGPQIIVIRGAPLPQGWTGKLWALEQARAHATTPLLLLLDADIELAPGMIAALRAKLRADRLHLVSLMARLHVESLWEKLLIPAFVYFFKLVYPFALANDPRWPGVAAAAGGCILVDGQMLGELGGFGALRDALIDDCTLAARVKAHGGHTWIGLSQSARSVRRYDTLRPLWDMVARSAFAQLRCSWLLLLGLSALFAVAFWLPVFCALGAASAPAASLAIVALAAMSCSYLPMLKFYRLSPAWALAMPLIGTIYLAMTWSSAWRWWRGHGATWKGRSYGPR
jgi:hopene-associated glycosyltransferase HpnB